MLGFKDDEADEVIRLLRMPAVLGSINSDEK
jgi:hypothetical protein